MARLHTADLLIWAPVVGNLVLAVWAALAGVRGRRTLPLAFWPALFVVLAVLAVQALSGMLLYAGGVRPRAGLHLLYGLLVAAAGAAQYGLRPGGFLRVRLVGGPAFPEPRIMALLCLTEGALLLRAWMTGAFGR